MTEVTVIVIAALVAAVTLFAMHKGYNIDIKAWFVKLHFTRKNEFKEKKL